MLPFIRSGLQWSNVPTCVIVRPLIGTSVQWAMSANLLIGSRYSELSDRHKCIIYPYHYSPPDNVFDSNDQPPHANMTEPPDSCPTSLPTQDNRVNETAGLHQHDLYSVFPFTPFISVPGAWDIVRQCLSRTASYDRIKLPTRLGWYRPVPFFKCSMTTVLLTIALCLTVSSCQTPYSVIGKFTQILLSIVMLSLWPLWAAILT